jgi:arginine deiminase
MRVIIDRFEGNFAVCEKEDRKMLNIKRNKLPADVKEGDVLIIEGDIISIDVAETTKRKNAVNKLFSSLFQKKDKT